MYKMNDTLKFIIVFLIICSILFINNSIILWLYLLTISVYNLYKRNKILSFVSLILIILLAYSRINIFVLFLFKLLLVMDILYTFYCYYVKNNNWLIRKSRRLRNSFYEENFDRIVDNINKKKEVYYGSDISIDEEIERELERKYIESRIRFYGFNNNIKLKHNVWTKLDILILLFSLIIFIFLIIIGR